MDSLTTHPATAQQATAFTSPASLSFPGGAGDLTPPSEKDGYAQANGKPGKTNGVDAQANGANAALNGNGVTPTTPAATPAAGQGVSGIVPTLQNIVATVNLDCRLDLKTIALHARNAEYNPKRFAAVIMRIREPKTTALIFASGKMVVTGAKSEDDSKLASRKYARIIQKLGFNAKFTDFKIQNIVGSCDIKFPIRLEGLASRHHNFSSYEPELFPGLIYRMYKPKIVLLIFVSGKIVLTGAKVREEIYQAFETIYPVLSDFLSTALAILSSSLYDETHLTIVDSGLTDLDLLQSDELPRYTPSAHTASIDSSRIIRPDYANPAYSKLAAEAQEAWRSGYGGEGVYHESGLAVVAGKSGNEYVEAACRNVEDKEATNVERLNNPQDIKAILGLPSDYCPGREQAEDAEQLGTTGYINRSSGWANAEGAMRTQMRRILEEHRRDPSRLTLRRAKAKHLLFSPTSNDSKPRVCGVQLTDSSSLRADLIILATGAWTPSLLDLTGRVQSTAQCLAYLPLTSSEAEAMSAMPVLLNLSTGYFVIPPAQNSASPSACPPSRQSPETVVYTHHLKVAGHCHGYLSPTPITIPTTPSRTINLCPSLPSSSPVPPPALKSLRAFISSIFGPTAPLSSRPFASSRLCHYTDTPTGDFLITYHPDYSNLFLCTGGSGHGFKFLPVLGREVLKIMERRGDGEWARLWSWKDQKHVGEWMGDGSRGGEKGVLLEDAMKAEGGDKDRRSKL
ncbi:MAG: hypothetical protein Q9168_004976 [Polycauliona sp. 1 TL-2023]